MAPPHTPAVNLGRQAAAIRGRFPAATVHLRSGQLVCTVELQPTPASRTYRIRLTYRQREHPSVIVLDPPLRVRSDADGLPHVYPGDRLCLYHHGEWDATKLLASTVLPWTSDWLHYYELWHATGIWLGGEAPH